MTGVDDRWLSWARPVVALPRPVSGWHRASTTRRVLAVLAVPVLAAWTAGLIFPRTVWEDPWTGAAVWFLYLVVGPVVCYALARVVRPHRGREVERLLRHSLAAAAVAYALPLMTFASVGRDVPELADGSGAALVLGTLVNGVMAVVLAVVTLVWGVVVAVVRACLMGWSATTQPPAASEPVGGQLR